MSNTFSISQVRHIAELAKLDLSEEQLQQMSEELGNISQHMDTLKELDLSDVKETSRTNTEENIWREDVVEKSLSQAEALKNAAQTYAGFFLTKHTLVHKDA